MASTDLDPPLVAGDTPAQKKRNAGDVPGLKSYGLLYGSSPVMLELYSQIERVAGTDATALIIGESGTGKELVARTIHDQSARKDAPFIAVNCGAIPDNLIEAELFGHEKGSFTGAVQGRVGYFEHANGGTLFLDEVTEMSPVRQVKLLRALETGTFFRVGGNDLIRSDVRVIAATNRDLEAEVRAGKFREDLFYRLQVMPIVLPSLRERRGDVALLARFYITRFNGEFRKHVRGLSPAAQDLLDHYAWPGNVRELRNAIERAMLLADRELLEPQDFTTLTRTVSAAHFKLPAEGVDLEEVERQLVVQALERANNNQTKAAELLGLNRDQVRYRMEKFGLRQT
jgi:DNA-binding NtrC family response regulator